MMGPQNEPSPLLSTRVSVFWFRNGQMASDRVFFLEEISPSDRATAGIIQDMSQYTSQLYKILPSGNLTFIVDFPIKNCDFP